jgi:hypothetical protein
VSLGQQASPSRVWLFPTGLTYLGFVTEGKLAAIFIKLSLGVSNWPVIYFINYTPTSSLVLFITAPPITAGGLLHHHGRLWSDV